MLDLFHTQFITDKPPIKLYFQNNICKRKAKFDVERVTYFTDIDQCAKHCMNKNQKWMIWNGQIQPYKCDCCQDYVPGSPLYPFTRGMRTWIYKSIGISINISNYIVYDSIIF